MDILSFSALNSQFTLPYCVEQTVLEDHIVFGDTARGDLGSTVL
jgi:hypothetical protein